VNLNKGWTWISIHAEDPKLADVNALTSSLTLSQNDMIKSQMLFDIYDVQSGWTGSLSGSGGMSSSFMYKVKMGQTNRLRIGGNEVDVSQWSSSLKSGWNWLSYPLSNNVSVKEALALFNASAGDVVKSQRSFSIYDPVVGWSGTLTYMVAGEGYMLKSATAQEFKYPDVFRSGSQSRANETEDTQVEGIDDWSAYEHNMSLIAAIDGADEFDGITVTDENGNLRGKGRLQMINDRNVAFITIYGNSSAEDKLTFLLTNGEVTAFAKQKAIFSPDVIIGSLAQPFMLTVSEVSVTAYPNPFRNTVHINVHATRDQQTIIMMTDILGNVIVDEPKELKKGLNALNISTDVPDGVYFVTIGVDGVRNVLKIIRN
jgi:hypothetical protein